MKKLMIYLIVVFMTISSVFATNYVYSGDTAGDIYKLNADNGTIISLNNIHSDTVNALDIYGDYLYSGGNDNLLQKMNLDDLTQVFEVTPHSSGILDIKVTSTGIYTSSQDNTVKKLDSAGLTVWTFSKHTDDVNTISVDSTGNVYSGGVDNKVYKIDSSGNEVWNITLGGDILDIDNDNDYIYFGVGSINKIFKYDVDGNQIWNVTSSASSAATSIVVDDYIYIGLGDGSSKIFYLNGSEKCSGSAGVGQTTDISVGTDGSYYISSFNDDVRKYNLSCGLEWTNTDYTVNVNSVQADEYISNPYDYETDGGLNYTEAGYAFNQTDGVNDTIAYDECLDTLTLREFYVSANNVLYTDIVCSALGYDYCIIGKCVSEEDYLTITEGILNGSIEEIEGGYIQNPPQEESGLSEESYRIEGVLGVINTNINIIFGLLIIIGLVVMTSKQGVNNPMVLMFVGIVAAILMTLLGFLPVYVLILLIMSLVVLYFLFNQGIQK